MSKKDSAPKNFGFGEDEAMLRDLARRFLDERLPIENLRRLVAEAPEPVYDQGQRSRWDEGLWKEIVGLGWTGLAVDEAEGGAGISLAGIAGVVEEVGRHALPSPLVATLGASLVLREAGTEGAKHVLSQIAAGSTASLAITGERGAWEASEPALEARAEGDEVVLDGSAYFVQDAFKADVLVASARLGEAVALFAVPADAQGVTLDADHIHDLTRDQATVRFEGVRVGSDAFGAGGGGAESAIETMAHLVRSEEDEGPALEPGNTACPATRSARGLLAQSEEQEAACLWIDGSRGAQPARLCLYLHGRAPSVCPKGRFWLIAPVR